MNGSDKHLQFWEYFQIYSESYGVTATAEIEQLLLDRYQARCYMTC